MAQSRTRTETEVETTVYVHDNRDVSFRDGIMHVHRQPQQPIRMEQWESSNGITTYTTVEWRDPVTGELRTSCNCPGWAIKRANRVRRCCHTDDMEGVKPCQRRRVDTQSIHSIEEAVEKIPDIHDGKELREIDLGDW